MLQRWGLFLTPVISKKKSKKNLLIRRFVAICHGRPHVSLPGLELAPLWKRLLSGQQARSLAPLFMTIYYRNIIGIKNSMSTSILHSCPVKKFYNSAVDLLGLFHRHDMSGFHDVDPAGFGNRLFHKITVFRRRYLVVFSRHYEDR